jgi:hypothetical protein
MRLQPSSASENAISARWVMSTSKAEKLAAMVDRHRQRTREHQHRDRRRE